MRTAVSSTNISVAVNHDHYFNFRLDVDVDGPVNSFVADKLVTKALPSDHPRRSIWVREPMTARTEHDGRYVAHGYGASSTLAGRQHDGGKSCRLSDEAITLLPGMSASTLLTPDDYPCRRAGFIETSAVGDALPEWKRNVRRGGLSDAQHAGTGSAGLDEGESLHRGRDIVLWHSIGMHHMVRGEDWPVMPVMWAQLRATSVRFLRSQTQRWISRSR